MPSPFPGMDPFIEGQRWEAFHAMFIVGIQETLMPQLVPRYIATIEEQLIVEYEPEAETSKRVIVPDVSIVEEFPSPSSVVSVAAPAVVAEVVQVVAQIAEKAKEVKIAELPEYEHRERFIEIRVRETGELVTVIELLSPANKQRGNIGWHLYLRKRREIFYSKVHLVELDLLRSGERLPIVEAPKTDYLALISRWEWRPKAVCVGWDLKDVLPTIPIPLKGRDEWVKLDLQAVFNTVYERGGYRHLLDYRRPVEPPLKDEERVWVEELLAKALQVTP
jgi:hypothetical protein